MTGPCGGDDKLMYLGFSVFCTNDFVSYWTGNTFIMKMILKSNFVANMSIVSTGLYIISMFTRGTSLLVVSPIYASLYNYILLPWEIDHMFT